MKIDYSNVKVSFDFTPAGYFLCYGEEERFGGKVWSLNYRIDRSIKGKSDDVGSPVIYLTEEQAEQCKKVGFTYIEF